MKNLPNGVRYAIVLGTEKMIECFDSLYLHDDGMDFVIDFVDEKYEEITESLSFIRAHISIYSYENLELKFRPFQQRYLALKESLKTE